MHRIIIPMQKMYKLGSQVSKKKRSGCWWYGLSCPEVTKHRHRSCYNPYTTSKNELNPSIRCNRLFKIGHINFWYDNPLHPRRGLRPWEDLESKASNSNNRTLNIHNSPLFGYKAARSLAYCDSNDTKEPNHSAFDTFRLYIRCTLLQLHKWAPTDNFHGSQTILIKWQNNSRHLGEPCRKLQSGIHSFDYRHWNGENHCRTSLQALYQIQSRRMIWLSILRWQWIGTFSRQYMFQLLIGL